LIFLYQFSNLQFFSLGVLTVTEKENVFNFTSLATVYACPLLRLN